MKYAKRQTGDDNMAWTLLILFCGAAIYSLLSVVAAWRYFAIRPKAGIETPPVSILKPLAGLDLGLEANLRTFFQQDYPAFEILFAVREPAIRRWRSWRSSARVAACAVTLVDHR